MEFYLDQSYGNEALKDVGRAISTKTAIPILTGILIVVSEEGVTFIASNSNIIIERYIHNDYVDVVETGSIVVPSRHFIEVVKKLPERIHISTNDFRVYIDSDEIQTSLNGMDPEEYPKFPALQREATFQVSGEGFQKLIRSTVFAIAKQESNPALTGVHLSLKEGELQATATNSHRLALTKIQNEEALNGDLIVPGDTLNELSKLLSEEDELHVVFSEANISFRTKRFTLYSRLIEGKFPNISDLIHTKPSTYLLVDRSDLIKSIDRACLFASDWHDYNVTVKILSDDVLSISSNSNEVGDIRETIRIDELQGEAFRVTFNGAFMLQALKPLNGNRVKLGFDGSMRPITIQDVNNQEQLHLISPVRTY